MGRLAQTLGVAKFGQWCPLVRTQLNIEDGQSSMCVDTLAYENQ